MADFHAPLPFSPFDLAAIGYTLVVVLLILGLRKLWSSMK